MKVDYKDVQEDYKRLNRRIQELESQLVDMGKLEK